MGRLSLCVLQVQHSEAPAMLRELISALNFKTKEGPKRFLVKMMHPMLSYIHHIHTYVHVVPYGWTGQSLPRAAD
jgi:hypothetical protein